MLNIRFARFCYVVFATTTAGSLVVLITNRHITGLSIFSMHAVTVQITQIRMMKTRWRFRRPICGAIWWVHSLRFQASMPVSRAIARDTSRYAAYLNKIPGHIH